MKQSASQKFKGRLRELRLACRWTQKRAAKSCGVGYKLYQLYELGIKANPGLLTLEKMANGFGLEIHELLAPVPTPRRRTNKGTVSNRGKSTRTKSRKNI